MDLLASTSAFSMSSEVALNTEPSVWTVGSLLVRIELEDEYLDSVPVTPTATLRSYSRLKRLNQIS